MQNRKRDLTYEGNRQGPIQLEHGNHHDRETGSSTGKYIDYVQELTARALTSLPAITLPYFMLTGELEGGMDED